MSLALTQREAAEHLHVSTQFFRAEVLPEIAVVRRGRRTIIPVAELERWLAANARAV